MCFVWIWKQTAIISLRILPRCRNMWEINICHEYYFIECFCWLVFNQKICVIWTALISRSDGTSALAQRSVAGLRAWGAGIDSRSVNVEIVVHKVAIGQFFLPVFQFSPVSIIPPLLHTHPSIYHPHCIMFFSQYFSFTLSVSSHLRETYRAEVIY